jgi:protease-4
VYADFIKRVAEGRKLTEVQVDEIAQGRVWSGVDAKKIGLVDELGGIDKALEIAVSKAKLTEYRVVNLPELKDPFEELISSLTDQTSTYFMKKELGTNYQLFMDTKKALQSEGIQVKMPFRVDID